MCPWFLLPDKNTNKTKLNYEKLSTRQATKKLSFSCMYAANIHLKHAYIEKPN